MYFLQNIRKYNYFIATTYDKYLLVKDPITHTISNLLSHKHKLLKAAICRERKRENT